MGGLVMVSVAVRRLHDHGNSCRGNHLIGADLQAQWFSPSCSWWGAWQWASSTSGFTSSRKRHWAYLDHLNPQSQPPSGKLLLTVPCFLIVPLPVSPRGPFPLKPPSWGNSHCIILFTCFPAGVQPHLRFRSWVEEGTSCKEEVWPPVGFHSSGPEYLKLSLFIL